MDNNEFFELYLEDTKENLNLISQTILKLEKDPSNKEYVQEMFRAAHTIKGSAGQMQFVEIQNITHKLEDLFGEIRDNEVEITSCITDTVLKTVDCLILLNEKLEDDTIVVDTTVVNDITYILSNLKGNETSLEKSTPVKEDIAKKENKNVLSLDSRFSKEEIYSKLTKDLSESFVDLIDSKSHIYYINALVDNNCDYSGIRMFMLLDALSTLGEVIATTPSYDEVESDSFKDSVLDILFVSNKEIDGLVSKFNSVLEIEVIECIDVSSFIRTEFSSKKEALIENEKTDIKKGQEVSNNVSKKEGSYSKGKGNLEHNLYVRVHTKTLDKLLNEQGELLLEYNRLCSVLEKGKKSELSMPEMITILDDIGTNINKINSTQQSIIMGTRMFPLEQLFSVFPRLVRDLSSKLNKKINLVVEGQDTELDRTILEKVSDPLKHIIRNAVDHGIESIDTRLASGKSEEGTIKLTAKQESDNVVITISDNGAGINPEILKAKAIEKGIYTKEQAEKLSKEEALAIIFIPGFSTATEVTEISGRGVGMDIVKSYLSEIGGIISLDSKLGEGTTFTVKIPLTLAISKALLVTVDKEKYIILLNYIQEVVEINREKDIKKVHQKEHIVLRGEKIYPLVYLRDVYRYPMKKNDIENIILLSNNGKQIGLVVDSFLGQQDIVIKSLNKYFGDSVKYEAGITKLGDGSIPIVVDVVSVMEDF